MDPAGAPHPPHPLNHPGATPSRMPIHHRIADLCAARTDRAGWIMSLLQELCIPHVVDTWEEHGTLRRNIVLPGASGEVRAVVAHHDVVNPASDNANDNSASVINAIALKLLRPEVLVLLTDGEEVGGLGAARFGRQYSTGQWGRITWALNLELTGRGGMDFLIGQDGAEGPLGDHIARLFPHERVRVPFNDAVVLRQWGIDAVVINPLPRLPDGSLDRSSWGRCHTEADSLDTIAVEEMRTFTEGVLVPLCATA
jgi:hypothetical protein